MVEDDDPTGIPGVNKPGMAGSMASRPPEQQQKFMDNEAIGVAKACFEFEACNAKNHIPDLSQKQSRHRFFYAGNVRLYCWSRR